MLCEHALALARDHGASTVTLWVRTQNTAARRFYETIGFTADGVTKTKKQPKFTLTGVRYRIEI